MNGDIVTAKWPVDSIRLDVLGTGRAIQLPSEIVLAADDVFRSMVDTEEELELFPAENDATGERFWRVSLGNFIADGCTPWQAIAVLADKLQWDGRKVCGRP